MKKIVWALFDDGEMSISKALDKEEYEVYNFGINEKENVNYADMSLTNKNKLLEQFRHFPKPDIIVASPPCQSFSIASAMKGGNACWRVNGNNLDFREESDYEGTRYNYHSQQAKAINGVNCYINTWTIINEVKPDFYYIENPKSSHIWKLPTFGTDFYNDTAYNNYGFPYKKPTRFLSNCNLHLNNNQVRPKHSFEDVSDRTIRSSIPKELILDIFKNFKKENKIIENVFTFDWE